jgi:hypothetical protein
MIIKKSSKYNSVKKASKKHQITSKKASKKHQITSKKSSKKHQITSIKSSIKTSKKTSKKVSKRNYNDNDNNVTYYIDDADFIDLTCKDTGKCVNFDNNILKDYFEYDTFEYLTDPQIRIGSDSANGVVNLFKYKRDSYESSSVLKSSKSEHADNLFYEYIVGKVYINEQIKYFPCFLETYSLYISEDQTLINQLSIKGKKSCKSLLSNLKKIDMSDFDYYIDYETHKEKRKELIKNSCSNGKYLSILIQYIHDPISIQSYVENNKNNDIFQVELIQILYQIYSVLAVLKDEFTHYDLHTENVLLYKIPNNEYITMSYTNDTNDVTTFNTQYIAKIIDYGRSFYYNKNREYEVNNSNTLYDIVESECRDRKDGYSFFDKTGNASNGYITSLKSNKSHDLRLAYLITKTLCIDDNCAYEFIKPTTFESRFGTPEKHSVIDETNNVNDLHTHLKQKLKKIDQTAIKKYFNTSCAGTLNIDLNRKEHIYFQKM